MAVPDRLPDLRLPRLPPAPRGLRIGLFGGTFNPPHPGHVLVAEAALRECGLDRIWWMVSPGNPLKANPPPPVATRIGWCRALIDNPRIVVNDVEAEIGTRFTVDSLRILQRMRPGVDFVYVMGADSFADLHRWRDWRGIMRMVPVAVVDRPGATIAAVRGIAARTFQRNRLPEAAARLLPLCRPPAWVMLYGKRSPLSSTAIRSGRNEHRR